MPKVAYVTASLPLQGGRPAGRPLRFASVELAKEYTEQNGHLDEVANGLDVTFEDGGARVTSRTKDGRWELVLQVVTDPVAGAVDAVPGDFPLGYPCDVNRFNKE